MWLSAHKGRIKYRTSFPNPVPSQKGTTGDDDQEGLGCLAQELTLLFVLLENQSTTIPPLLHKDRGKRKKGRKQTKEIKIPRKERISTACQVDIC